MSPPIGKFIKHERYFYYTYWIIIIKMLLYYTNEYDLINLFDSIEYCCRW